VFQSAGRPDNGLLTASGSYSFRNSCRSSLGLGLLPRISSGRSIKSTVWRVKPYRVGEEVVTCIESGRGKDLDAARKQGVCLHLCATNRRGRPFAQRKDRAAGATGRRRRIAEREPDHPRRANRCEVIRSDAEVMAVGDARERDTIALRGFGQREYRPNLLVQLVDDGSRRASGRRPCPPA
jgi:hypothetical protein